MLLDGALQLLLVKLNAISLKLLVQWLIIEVALNHSQIFIASVIYSLAFDRFDHRCIRRGVKLKTALQRYSRQLSTLIESADATVVVVAKL
jgi:hypothetical protein